MARISGINAIKDTLDTYSSSSGEFFSLKDDGDQARVRFNHKGDDDLDVFVVHKVNYKGKDKYVECLSPADGQICPFCQAGLKPQVRMFLTVFDTRDNKIKIWDRGKKEITKICSLIARYGSLSDREYDVERVGKKGDFDTTYNLYPLDPTPNPLDNREDIYGEDKFVSPKTADEMQKMLPDISTQGPAQSGSYSAQNRGNSGAGGKMF